MRMRFELPFITVKEEISPTLQLFRQIDLDRDGFICKDDVKHFLKQFDIKLTKNNLDILSEVFQRSLRAVLYKNIYFRALWSAVELR